jgi:hypothetical protein
LQIIAIDRFAEQPVITDFPIKRSGCNVAFSLSSTLKSLSGGTTMQHVQMLSSKGRERRNSRRCAPSRVTTCSLSTLEGESLGTAQVYNLSSVGMGLLVTEPIKPGTTIRVNVTNALCTFYLCMDLFVVRCIRVPAGKDYFLGGQFDRRLKCEELQPFIM